ncbi:uncharacterized protein PAC_05953 [Phialocephala subalpina]|uniref:Uncharacterized protein n=1 Tax=Phialocephala subalpina TaxID=576137 RepID=A0A1L7WTG2_9HELO|nr:uncharacterized protein PAC_05953 [Phialocephala subalpina]
MPPKMIRPPPGAPPVVGPPGGPIYQLWSGNKLDVAVHCIVVVTDTQKRLDRQEFGAGNSPLRPLIQRTSPWFRRSGNVDGPMDRHNTTVHDAAHPIEPQLGRVVETTGGINPNHRLVIMANVNIAHPTRPNRHLRNMYCRSLRCARNLPANGGQPWRQRPQTIAFELIGSNPLPWSTEEAADHALNAITRWFAEPTSGAARRAVFSTVLLMVPTAPQKNPARIRRAWERAWDKYIEVPPVVPPAGAPTNNFIQLRRGRVVQR